ncbi:MAG: protein kinase [Thermoleophilia bacterium]|nr:protein kinase [Thermoleophilia bacterium]
MTGTSAGDRYEFQELLGRGGMASVWRAHDPILDREVAVKRLHAGLTDDDELADRFDREARLVAGLSHPNIVRLLDRGHDAEGPYLVLELVEGENLKVRVRRDGALPQDEAVHVCAQVARGLAVAHDSGIVHRDIKAQNVLLARDGAAKLTDFGIARLAETIGTELTRTGMLVGSADYLSPEQAAGERLDSRSDIYSLGVVLFEALTGSVPYSADNVVAVAMKHISEPFPDPRERVSHISDHLAECVLRATAKEPEARFGTAHELAEALEGAPVVPVPERTDSATLEIPVQPRSRTGTARRRGRLGPIAIGVGALAIAVVAGLAALSFDFAGGPDGDAEAAPAAPIVAASVSDLDPEGDGTERASLVAAATDGDLETAWYTENYATAAFGNLKQRVGLAVSFAGPIVATELELSSPTPGAQFEVTRASDPTPLTSGIVPQSGRFGLIGHEPTETYEIWITGLVDDPESTSARRFRAGIGEVVFAGSANTSGDGSVA